MRPPNEIDFWRGLALATIFIDHVPGLIFETYTLRSIAISDAAELFVFLAGWAVQLVTSSTGIRRLNGLQVVLRLEGRALTIFCAQIVITELALALTAAASLYFEDPLLLEANNAAAVFESPVEAHLGLVMLTHQLGYFDILPLYVVLMAGAPIVVLLDRYLPRALLPVSLSIYAAALVSGVNLPTWPVEGQWYFNPLAWQLNFVLGFSLAKMEGVGRFLRAHRQTMRWLSLPVLGVGLVVAWRGWAPDPLTVPEPKLFFMFDKTYASPARVIEMLALIGVFAGSFKYIERFAAVFTSFFSTLGRNSLNVFCVGSLLSLAAQFARTVIGGGLRNDTIVLALAIVCMYATAWLSEWRERTRP